MLRKMNENQSIFVKKQTIYDIETNKEEKNNNNDIQGNDCFALVLLQ